MLGLLKTGGRHLGGESLVLRAVKNRSFFNNWNILTNIRLSDVYHGHQSISFIAYPSWMIKLSVFQLWEQNLEIGQCYSMRHLSNFSTLILVLTWYPAWQFKLFCNEENLHFVNFHKYYRISLCARTHYFMYVKGKHQGHRIVFSDF